MTSPALTSEELLQAPLALLDSRFAQRMVRLPSGAQVSVRECGRSGGRPTAVLLHGIGSGAASWLHVALLVCEHAHVLAWDAPGYGESTPLPGDAPADSDYAGRLDELLRTLGIERCVLVGHSLGALMACAYARGPGASRVARLLLISPAGGYGGPGQAAVAGRVRSERRETLHTLGVAGLAERSAARLLSPAADAKARAWVAWNSARLRPSGYLQAVELLCAGDLARNAGLETPVEVYCGDADTVTPPEGCRNWAEFFHAGFELIEGAGHAGPVEQPGAVARIALRAIERAEKGPGHG